MQSGKLTGALLWWVWRGSCTADRLSHRVSQGLIASEGQVTVVGVHGTTGPSGLGLPGSRKGLGITEEERHRFG